MNTLLQLICQAVENHTDKEVLKMSLKTLEKLCEIGSPRFSKCEAVRTFLIDSIVAQFKTAMQRQSNSAKQAFIILCDLLIYLRNGEHGSGPAHCQWGVLPSYSVDEELQDLLNDFVQREVFTDCEMSGISVESDEDEQKKYELHRRRCFLASFCKLIVYNFGEKYGDIIKATLSKARDINKVECARTMVLSLMTLFSEMCDKEMIIKSVNQEEAQEEGCGSEERCSTHVDRQSEEFLALKEMAKRFALSFGLDSVKNREAVTALHRDGILFAVQPLEDPLGSAGPPPNLPFLEILAEFTFKLLNQDKRVVLSYLDQRIATGMASGSGEDWRPLLLYRNSLVHGESTSATPIMPVSPTANNSSGDSEAVYKSPLKLNPRRIKESDAVEEEIDDDVESILPSKLPMEEVVVEPSTEFFTGPTVQLSLPFNQADCLEEPLPSSSSRTRRLNVVSYLHRPSVGYPRSWIPAVSILPGYTEDSSSRSGVKQKREKSSATGSG
ncbi:hypothetical protein J437_LFUL007981 [Ladona fulva]|uniref:Cohesin subunit SCC3/SA HEAT-repeats domain-containing protein n=1 Tax=Ladona fulva TaxID=123851 RepID=A0A8K0K540_LADFU|nr:hypothetical protein J437_LFUL007981 [Ladona fulva]